MGIFDLPIFWGDFRQHQFLPYDNINSMVQHKFIHKNECACSIFAPNFSGSTHILASSPRQDTKPSGPDDRSAPDSEYVFVSIVEENGGEEKNDLHVPAQNGTVLLKVYELKINITMKYEILFTA